MQPSRQRVHGGIYLNYLLHYIAHWPVTAADLRTMANDHGFSGFANFFDSLPKKQCFGCPDEVKTVFEVAHPAGKVAGLDDR